MTTGVAEIEERLLMMASAEGAVRHVEVVETIGSTNSTALEDGRQGLVLLAMEQTSGLGRHGNEWRSPRGGVYMSYVPTDEIMPARLTDLSLLASLAVARVVESTLEAAGVRGPKALLKWPNDVLVGDGKVGGVLVQSRGPPRAVVGVGVNVNTPVDLEEDRSAEEWPVGARSLCQVAGRDLDLAQVAHDLLEELVHRTGEGLDGDAVQEYRSRCHTLGKRVAFTEGTERRTGTAVDIDPDGGALLVRMEGGELQRVTSGEVRHVRSVKG